MDTRCTRCWEPWGTESVYEAIREREEGWDIRIATILECPCCASNERHNGKLHPESQGALRDLADMLGSDLCGQASMFEDLDYSGALEDVLEWIR